jgi:hypothetical protein
MGLHILCLDLDIMRGPILPDDDIACKSGSWRRAFVRVLPDDEARHIPREAAAGSNPWPAWTWRAYDAFQLADAARAAFAAISPKVPRCHTFLVVRHLHVPVPQQPRTSECRDMLPGCACMLQDVL